MTRRSVRDDDEDDWTEEEAALEDCPHCGSPIVEDAPMCPYCKNWISDEEELPTQRPTWFVVTAVLCLLMVILWIFGH